MRGYRRRQSCEPVMARATLPTIPPLATPFAHSHAECGWAHIHPSYIQICEHIPRLTIPYPASDAPKPANTHTHPRASLADYTRVHQHSLHPGVHTSTCPTRAPRNTDTYISPQGAVEHVPAVHTVHTVGLASTAAETLAPTGSGGGPQLQLAVPQIAPIAHSPMHALPQVSTRCFIPLQGAKEIKPDLSTGEFI